MQTKEADNLPSLQFIFHKCRAVDIADTNFIVHENMSSTSKEILGDSFIRDASIRTDG
jgi:hypothetical protein